MPVAGAAKLASPPPTDPAMDATRAKVMTIASSLTAFILSCAVLYAAAMTWLWFNQERLLFAPAVLPPDRSLSMASDVHELAIDVPGARLSALHLRLPDPKGVVFFLHGNGGSLETWFVNPGYYRRANFDLFMIDYRGYGKSTGQIASEEQLRADVRAAWAVVARQYAGRKVVVYGRSLGSGLAAGLSAELQGTHAAALTVLVSPYSSMAALAAQHYRWVPQFLLRYPMRTDTVIARVQGPLLLIHGAQDPLIPPSHSLALQALAPHASLAIIERAAHNDLQEFDDYLNAFARALAAL